jgi:DNA-binding transcriptional MocR family regulator
MNPLPSIPRYQQIAENIAEMIGAGTFAPGGRVPSIRRLSTQMGVSLTTVIEAYRVLENQDLIEARPQSGFYVKTVTGVPPAPAKSAGAMEAVPLEINSLVVRLLDQAGDCQFISFGAAVPHASFLPTEALNRITAREIRARPETSQSYDSVHGYAALREQVSRRALDAGFSVGPDEIVTTNGAQHAVFLALSAVTSPGDTVAVESPTYVGLLQVLEVLNLRALEVSTDPEEGICLECLAEALDREPVAACVLVPTFGNPLGHNMPEEGRRQLVDLVDAAGVPLIEDDVYGELHFDRVRQRAVKAFDRQGSVLYCSSLSKTLAPGYRVGWMAPGRYQDAVERCKNTTSVSSPTLTQMGVAAYLGGGAYDRHLRRLRSTYCGLVSRFSAAVAEHFPTGPG